MKRNLLRGRCVFMFMLIIPGWIAARSDATVKGFSKTYTPYLFSDPDPVANNGKIYLYFR